MASPSSASVEGVVTSQNRSSVPSSGLDGVMVTTGAVGAVFDRVEGQLALRLNAQTQVRARLHRAVALAGEDLAVDE